MQDRRTGGYEGWSRLDIGKTSSFVLSRGRATELRGLCGTQVSSVFSVYRHTCTFSCQLLHAARSDEIFDRRSHLEIHDTTIELVVHSWKRVAMCVRFCRDVCMVFKIPTVATVAMTS